MSDSHFILEAHGVHKSYPAGAKELQVLKGIDLQVKKGETLSIIGPSGAGKSTLLHILGGLDKPTRGKVIFSGIELNRVRDDELCRIRNARMGFVFQFYHLLPEFSAIENLMLPAIIAGRRKNDARAKAAGLLEMVGLKDRALHRPGRLSGGEQQRVAIARSLVNDPEIVFCDEPTGNLDSKTGREIIELLWELNRKAGQTFVTVTHDEHIAKLSSRVVHIQDGKLVG